MSAPGASGGGHRMLAAIVFTDVVGYSVLAGQDEAKAIALFRRDYDIIAATCAEYEGQVLKNTGDGLLLCFTSAVQAVNCSIKIQQLLHEQSENVPKGDVLQHRIGVHLGDVVLMPDDVIGDGVNVANRIQNEARPGGIAMSQTVYDVVRNKVKVNATSLGVRNLKHIVEPVTVWAIPPIGSLSQSPYLTNTPAQEQMMGDSISTFEEPKPDGAKGVLYAILAAVLLLVPIGMFFYIRSQPAPKKPPVVVVGDPKADLDPSKTTGGVAKADNPKSDDTPKDEKQDPKQDDPPKVQPDKNGEVEVEMPTDQEEAPLKDLAAKDGALRDTMNAFKQKYDFEGATKWLEDQGYTEAPAGKLLRDRYEELGKFRTWLESQITFATQADPLILIRPSGETRIYGGSDGSIEVQTNVGTTLTQLIDIKPENFLLIARAAMVQNQPGDKKPRIVIRRWMGLFAREYGLPAPRVPRN